MILNDVIAGLASLRRRRVEDRYDRRFRINRREIIGAAIATTSFPPPAMAAPDDPGVKSEILLQATAAWDNTPYDSYPRGAPEISVRRISIPANAELKWHSHPMPNAAYVLSGEITVEEPSGIKRHFSAGQVIAESVNHWHRGVVGDEPAVFIVFYAGVTGMPPSRPKP
jgi:quercetin dioxygenase-like cupin family protein